MVATCHALRGALSCFGNGVMLKSHSLRAQLKCFLLTHFEFTDTSRDRRFIILGDSNVGLSLSFGGSIGSGIITSSKFKGKNFTVKRRKKKKIRKYREDFK